MITWRRQGAAIVGELSLLDGRLANIALVGCSQNPKGVALVLPGAEGEKPSISFFPDILELVPPVSLLDILCMQERAFGKRGLPEAKGIL